LQLPLFSQLFYPSCYSNLLISLPYETDFHLFTKFYQWVIWCFFWILRSHSFITFMLHLCSELSSILCPLIRFYQQNSLEAFQLSHYWASERTRVGLSSLKDRCLFFIPLVTSNYPKVCKRSSFWKPQSWEVTIQTSILQSFQRTGLRALSSDLSNLLSLCFENQSSQMIFLHVLNSPTYFVTVTGKRTCCSKKLSLSSLFPVRLSLVFDSCSSALNSQCCAWTAIDYRCQLRLFAKPVESEFTWIN